MASDTDAHILSSAIAGDERALAEVGRRARAAARRALRRHFCCSDDLEDCVQEAVVRAVERIGQLREPERLEAWVATIARRVAFARQRDNVTLPLPLNALAEAASQATPPTLDPRLAEEVEVARQRLCAARRELLDLRYRDDLSYADIALRLRTNVPVVRRRLQGARDQLRKEVLRTMASPNGDAIVLDRQDLHRLYAAASLADLESEGHWRAVHLSGRKVVGGTTHRAAFGLLSCKGEVPDLALDPAPLLRLADEPQPTGACLGWDEEEVRLALDDGTLLRADRLDCEPRAAGAWAIVDGPLSDRAEASRAEFLEFAEIIAATTWRWGDEDSPVAAVIASLSISPDLISGTVFRQEPVAFMLGGCIGAITPPEKTVTLWLNRAYLRDCLAALPREAERVVVEYESPLHALRFSCPDCPGLWTAMMPIHPDAAPKADIQVVRSG